MDIKDKVVIITGSSSGIGEATAKLFASKGAHVVVNCLSNIEGAKKVVKECKSAGANSLLCKSRCGK